MEKTVSDRKMSAVLDILEMMVSCGAEIYRVEESAKRIFSSFGLRRVDVFATTSSIIVSIETASGEILTHTRRVTDITPDVEKVHLLNDLARRISINGFDLESTEAEIIGIKNSRVYPVWLNIAAYAAVSGAFYFFFGGRNVVECLISLMLGAVTGVASYLGQKLKIRKIIYKFICSFIFSLFAVLCTKYGIIASTDYVIIANIMTLIPGVGLMESIRDLFFGDSVSGLLRFIEAVILASVIACGYVVSVLIGGVL